MPKHDVKQNANIQTLLREPDAQAQRCLRR